MKELKNRKGITLVALVITVIALLILAGVTIAALTGQNGILNKSKEAEEENNKKTATEMMNLKITSAQMASYAEKQEMPTLAYLAAYLEKDKETTGEIEYVNAASKQVATLNESAYEGWDKIYTKLSKYPYEFEIDKNLKLASIDGVKIADTSSSNEIEELKATVQGLQGTIGTMQTEIATLKQENTEFKNKFNETGKVYTQSFGEVSCTANERNKLASITLPAGTYVVNGGSWLEGGDIRWEVWLGDFNLLGNYCTGYDSTGWAHPHISAIVSSKDTKTYDFGIYPSKSITISGGEIRAVRIGD